MHLNHQMAQFDNDEADRDGMSVNILANNDKRTALLVLQHRGCPRMLTAVSDDHGNCRSLVTLRKIKLCSYRSQGQSQIRGVD
jgi:hypothetical protein